MVKVFINNKLVLVPNNTSVLEACETIGVQVPRFCYHERLNVAGNCRMCLVEIQNAPKPVASCAWPVSPEMRVFTDTPLVQKARESVLEFLLVNHPLWYITNNSWQSNPFRCYFHSIFNNIS